VNPLQFQDPLDHAIRFFAAATPFLTALTLFVALLILLLRYRPPKRDDTTPPSTEEERRDRIVELVERLMKSIL
jgi:hypothetical protein